MPITDRAADNMRIAWSMIEAAVATPRETGEASRVAVVNEAGQPKAFHAMDGAPNLAVQIARDEVWTASSYGTPTRAWRDMVNNDRPLLNGIKDAPRPAVLGGG